MSQHHKIDKATLMAEATNSIADKIAILSIKNHDFNVKFEKHTTKVSVIDTELEEKAVDVIFVMANGQSSMGYFPPYKEGSNEEPICQSDNGVGPSIRAKMPQALLCSACPRNQWGPNGTECKPSKKVAAVIPKYDSKKPVLIRIPTASRGAFKSYLDGLRNVQIEDGTEACMLDVVTRIYFHPGKLNILDFKVLRVLSQDEELTRNAYELVTVGKAEVRQLVNSGDVRISEAVWIEHKAKLQTTTEQISQVAEVKHGALKALSAKATTMEIDDEIITHKEPPVHEASLDEDADFLQEVAERNKKKAKK